MDNGIYKIAPDVSKTNEYNQFYQNHKNGQWITKELYHISTSSLSGCTDKDREPSDTEF
jgi:hypothetical protein